MFPTVSLRLPEWMREAVSRFPEVLVRQEDRMRLAIYLARKNIEQGTGGPFGAAVFDGTGRLVAPGVNLVMSSNCSAFHAEIVALTLAQTMLGRFDLSDGGRLKYELVSTTEPCAMCFGALPWSGISGLICGARDEDARMIGFDEGPKMDDWISALASRGIIVEQDVLRKEAAAVLGEYAEAGGIIYNARRVSQP